MNRSKTYLAPLVLVNIDILPFDLIGDTFIFSDFRPLEPTIYIEIKEDERVTPKLLDELLVYDEVEEIFKMSGGYLLVTVLDSQYNFEYLCFLRGNYSWYNPVTKDQIVTYLTTNVNKRSFPVVDKVRSVFARDPMLKHYYEEVLDVQLKGDAELGSRMNKEKETFNSIDYEEFQRYTKDVDVSAK